MELRVRYAECDMQGRAFNGNYLTWVDMAGADAISHIAGGYSNLASSGIDYVVARAELQFRRPSTFNDLLTIQVWFRSVGNSSLRSEYTIHREDDLIAECVMVHVCVDSKTFEKRRWPQWLHDHLAG